MESLSAHSMTLKQVVEALVFASPKPLTTKEIVTALKSAGNPEKTDDAAALEYAKAKEPDIEAELAAIAEDLIASGRSFRLMEQVNGWSLVTDPAAVHWVRQLYPEAKPTRLTGPQLETLAIIAYRQPVTRADIEAVRGVAVDSVVQVLMERSLIKIAGRADVPGRPLLYATTEYFLQHFGLKNVTDLPNSQELRRIELPKAEVPAEAPAGDAANAEAPAAKGGKGKKAAAAAAAVATADSAAPASTEAPTGTVPDEASPTEASVEPAAVAPAEEIVVAAADELAVVPEPEPSSAAEAPTSTGEPIVADEPPETVAEVAPEPPSENNV